MLLGCCQKYKFLVLLLILIFVAGFQNAYSQDLKFKIYNEPLKINLEVRQLSMEDAVKLALLNNPRVTIEEALLDHKWWAIRESKSYLLPTVYFSEEFMTSNNPVQAFMMRLNQRNLTFNPATINEPGVVNNFSTRVGGEWVLFDRKIYKDIEISKLELEIQKYLSEQEIHDLVYEVRQAYLDVQLSQAAIETARENLDQSRVHLEAVKARRGAGLSSKSDFLSARVNYATQREELSRARNQLNLAWILLGELIGDESIIGYDLISSMHEDIAVDDIDRLVKYSFLHNPAITAVEMNKKLAVLELEQAKNTGSMTIKAYGEWGVDTIFDDADIARSFTAGAKLYKPLFLGGLRKARVKQAESGIVSSNARIEQIYSNVKVQVVQNYLSLLNAQDRLQMTNDVVNDALQSLKNYNARYAVGLATNIEVETAQANLAKAQMLRVHALHDLNMAMVSLQRAIGMPLDKMLEGKELMVSEWSPQEKEFEITRIKTMQDKTSSESAVESGPDVEVEYEADIIPENQPLPLRDGDNIDIQGEIIDIDQTGLPHIFVPEKSKIEIEGMDLQECDLDPGIPRQDLEYDEITPDTSPAEELPDCLRNFVPQDQMEYHIVQEKKSNNSIENDRLYPAISVKEKEDDDQNLKNLIIKRNNKESNTQEYLSTSIIKG